MDFFECNRCGKCREFCPTYRLFLNEAFSPRGRAQILLFFERGKLLESKALRDRIFSCLLCGACVSNCPLQVNVPNLVYEGRQRMTKNLILLIFKYFPLYPRLFFLFLKALNSSGPLKKILKKQKSISMVFLDKISIFENKLQEKNSLQIFNKVKPKGRVALFLGCSTNFLMPSIRDALIKILLNANLEVILPRQNCCGAPLLSAGFKKEGIELARKNVKTYKSFNIDGVVTPCPTCAHFIGTIYKELCGEVMNVINLVDLISPLSLSREDDGKKKFFHVSCHSSHYIKDIDKILSILKTADDFEKKEGCCGFGGLFSFLFEQSSMDILRKKVLEYEKADMIITSCPNCIIQFKFAMQNKKILHYAEFINKNLSKGEKNVR